MVEKFDLVFSRVHVTLEDAMLLGPSESIGWSDSRLLCNIYFFQHLLSQGLQRLIIAPAQLHVTDIAV